MLKNKIILFAPKPLDIYIKYPPYSMLAVAGPVLKEGYSVNIVHASIEPNYVDKVISLLDDSVLVVGISSMTGEQIKGGIEVAKAVRTKNPNIPVVWGGYHPSLLPKETCSSEYVDVVVKGQGERTFLELCNALRDNKPLDQISGIVFKRNGVVKENVDRIIENVNNFPLIPWHLIDVGKYVNENMEIGKRTIAYITSRGCPFRCAFCAEPMVSKRRWSGLDAKRVVDDLEFLVKNYNVDSFIFSDNNFFIDKERVREICRDILNRGLRIRWGEANGRTENLIKYDDTLWEFMVKSGLYSILVGAESGLPEALKAIEKDATVEDTIKFAEKCTKYGVRVSYSLMIGLPGMDIKEEMKETVNMISKINKIQSQSSYKYHDRFLIFFYCPYPGTKLWEKSLTYGLECPKTLVEWGSWTLDTRHCKWIPEGLDLKALRMIIRFAANAFEPPPHIAAKIRSNLFLGVTYNIGYKTLHIISKIRVMFRWFYYPVEFSFLQKMADGPVLRTLA